MRYVYVLVYLLGLVIISGCSTSYKELSKKTYAPSDEFSKYLLDQYKLKADFEAKKMHDWNSVKLYSEKALSAVSGKKVKPEKINYWNISTIHIEELQEAYNNLMIVYEDAIITDPYHLAVAISSLDCWAEQQEENWQTWDIKKCKDDFLNAMHEIYNVLDAENNKKEINKKEINDSVSVVTKNNNEEILQIIYFDFDKSNLSDVSFSAIKNFIEKNKNKISRFLVVGHTDTKGSNEYNMKLSLERAITVKKILIDLGIDQENINILAKGENKLLVQTRDEVAHPANRRAEISPLN